MDSTSFDLILRSLPLLFKGAVLSLQIFAIASVLSLILGSIMGTLLCRRLRCGWFASAIEAITFVLRAVPCYVQLLIAYFVLPDLLGIELEAFTAAIIALSLCSAGYTAQIVRGGLNAIPKEQWEAAFMLGYSVIHSLRFIIFPQLLRNILPALTGECDALLKSTAILASIGLLELTRMGMNIVSREMDPLPIYLAVAALYIGISAIINIISKKLEKRIRYVNN
ncbi:MAG TPA: amino acid ABC transporter permease [Parachlamydiaceae bacterium]|nr:amino acid ABC transporter permease [Parachlamydiaceae bacterium]